MPIPRGTVDLFFSLVTGEEAKDIHPYNCGVANRQLKV